MKMLMLVFIEVILALWAKSFQGHWMSVHGRRGKQKIFWRR